MVLWNYATICLFEVRLNVSTMRDSDCLLHVVILLCALHAAAPNCEHTGDNNIMLTFRFRIYSNHLRKGNWRFVLRFKEGNWHFNLLLIEHYKRKWNVSCLNCSTTIQKRFRDHPNTNSSTLSKEYREKRLHNSHVDRFVNCVECTMYVYSLHVLIRQLYCTRFISH